MDGPPPVQAAVKTEKRWETRREPAVGAGHRALLGAAEIILPKNVAFSLSGKNEKRILPRRRRREPQSGAISGRSTGSQR